MRIDRLVNLAGPTRQQPERKVRDGNMEREVQCIAEAHSFDRVCNGGTDSHTAFEI